MADPYAPDETSAQIFIEEMWLQGSLVSNIAYGIEFTLFCLCFANLTQQMSKHNMKQRLFLLAFTTLIFIFGTIFMITNCKFVQMAFINNRDFPGGPGAYEVAMFSEPVDEAATAVFVISNWFMDAFVVWRFMIIYKGSRRIWSTILLVLPCMMLLASVALGIIFLVSTRASSPFSEVDLTIAYYVMSLALNVIVTILIVGRILFYRWRIARARGWRHASPHSNAAAVVVESASLYSIFAILYLVPFGVSYALADAMINIVSQVQTISSLLIIYRLSSGKGWVEDTGAQLMSHASGSAVQLRKLASARVDNNAGVNSIASKEAAFDDASMTREMEFEGAQEV